MSAHIYACLLKISRLYWPIRTIEVFWIQIIPLHLCKFWMRNFFDPLFPMSLVHHPPKVQTLSALFVSCFLTRNSLAYRAGNVYAAYCACFHSLIYRPLYRPFAGPFDIKNGPVNILVDATSAHFVQLCDSCSWYIDVLSSHVIAFAASILELKSKWA